MMTFFREWLPLAKSDFRILALLADKGDFDGNLSDLCRCFSLDTQTKNRNKLREAILRLAAAGLIPAIFYKHYPSYAAHQMNVSELARICGLSRPTVYKYLKMVG